MRKSDVIKHFGTGRAVAKALGISEEAVYQWGEFVPPRRAYEIQRLTNGELVPNWPSDAVQPQAVNQKQ